jgi:Mg-chelatase subunit ChlD
LSVSDIDLDDLLPDSPGAQRRSHEVVLAPRGRSRSSIGLRPGEPVQDLALNATMKQAVMRQIHSEPTPSQPLHIQQADLRRNLRYRPSSQLIVFVLDTSDSMGDGTVTRMKAAKGAVLAILRKAYQNRNRVALVAFGGEEARVILSPTRSVSLARTRLASLPTGGATPFADGLFKAWKIIQQDRLKHSGANPLLVIISDGEANVPLVEGRPSLPELFELAAAIRRDQIPALIMDVVTEPARRADLTKLARQLGAQLRHVDQLRAAHILQAIRIS